MQILTTTNEAHGIVTQISVVIVANMKRKENVPQLWYYPKYIGEADNSHGSSRLLV